MGRRHGQWCVWTVKARFIERKFVKLPTQKVIIKGLVRVERFLGFRVRRSFRDWYEIVDHEAGYGLRLQSAEHFDSRIKNFKWAARHDKHLIFQQRFESLPWGIHFHKLPAGEVNTAMFKIRIPRQPTFQRLRFCEWTWRVFDLSVDDARGNQNVEGTRLFPQTTI